jgi:hypothetical protein
VIEAGQHIQIAGTGSPGDPFVVIGDVDLEVTDTSVFNLTLNGAGTLASPWELSVGFAATAALNDLPDVNAPAPANGQVLGWDSATGQWTPRAPTSAASGAVLHDPSLAGDGSAGTPLQVAEDPDRMLATSAGGLGLSDTGMNSVVRRFADDAARDAAAPAPVPNALSILGTSPGQVDYWDGSQWLPASQFKMEMAGQEMLALSGSYTGTERVTLMVRNVTETTDTAGVFDVISSADLAGRGGVITAYVQAMSDSLSIPVPFSVMLAPDAGAVRGVAFRLDDGQPAPSTPVRATVTAFLY